MAKNEKAKSTKEKPVKKDKKPNKVARWFKDLKGEIKKIFWPDGKTVLKNTLIVIVVVAIAAVVIYLFDFAMSSGLKGVKKLAGKDTTTSTTSSAASALTGKMSADAFAALIED